MCIENYAEPDPYNLVPHLDSTNPTSIQLFLFLEYNT